MEQYNYLVTVWCIFSCDSGAAYCSKDEEVRILSFSICPLREDSSFSQRSFLLYARSYINPQLTCPQKTAIINLYKQEDLLKCSEPVTFAMAKVLGKVKKSKEQ